VCCVSADNEEDVDESEDAPEAVDDAESADSDLPESADSDPLEAADTDPPDSSAVPPAIGPPAVPSEAHMDRKHGVAPSVRAERERVERAARIAAARAAAEWSVVSALGQAGENVAAALADDAEARHETIRMRQIIAALRRSSTAAVQQPEVAIDPDDDATDASVDWRGEPRSVPHERPPPELTEAAAAAADRPVPVDAVVAPVEPIPIAPSALAAAAAAVAAGAVAPVPGHAMPLAPPATAVRRSGRVPKSRAIMGKDGIVLMGDLLFTADEEDDSPRPRKRRR
jgi:hypothetical protein